MFYVPFHEKPAKTMRQPKLTTSIRPRVNSPFARFRPAARITEFHRGYARTLRFPDGRMRRRGFALARFLASFFVIALLVALPPTLAQGEGKFVIKAIGEKPLSQLPQAPLYWRLKTFPTLAAAEAAAGPTSVAADVEGRFWLFTLGAPGAQRLAAPKSPKSALCRRRLRPPQIDYASTTPVGPPGRRRPSTQPGSETFDALGGDLSQRTPRRMRLEAGQSMPGHAPGMATEVSSSGRVTCMCWSCSSTRPSGSRRLPLSDRPRASLSRRGNGQISAFSSASFVTLASRST